MTMKKAITRKSPKTLKLSKETLRDLTLKTDKANPIKGGERTTCNFSRP